MLPRTGKHRQSRRSRVAPALVAAAALIGASLTIASGYVGADQGTNAVAQARAFVSQNLIARDSFARQTQNGLGTPDLGGVYSGSTGKAQLSANAGQAIIANLQPATGAEQHLPQSSAQDAQMQATLHIPPVNSAKLGLHFGNEFRRQQNGDRYDVSVLLYANGQINIAAAAIRAGVSRNLGESKVLTTSGNNNIVEQTRIVGTNPVVLLGRVWVAGQPVPDWQFSATDSSPSALSQAGISGLDLYESTSGTVTRYAMANLYVWRLAAPAASGPGPVSSGPNPVTTPPTGKPSSNPTPPPSNTPTPTPTPTGPPTGTTTSALGLDPTGQTIPDTDYPIPADAVFMSTSGSPSNPGSASAPVSTLNAAISRVANGGTIVVESGVYRDWYNDGAGNFAIFGKSFTIQAAPHAQAWFDGSDVEAAQKWTSDGQGHWYMQWSTPSFCNGHYYDYAFNQQPHSNTGPCSHWDMYSSQFPASQDPQMIFGNGKPMSEVTDLQQVSSNKFYYAEDLTHKTGRIYIGSDPAQSEIEVSARPVALVTGASNFNIKGIGFRRYATNEYSNLTTAAVYDCCGKNMVVQDSVFMQNANMGLMMAATASLVKHSVFSNNGGQGFGSSGHQSTSGAWDGLVIDSNVVAYNNAEHMGVACTLSCDQSGIKLTHMGGFTVSNNIVEFNSGGPGIWCDEACVSGRFIYNIVHDNKTGIFDEVSSGGVIASNLVYNNVEYGIRDASYGDKIYNNTSAGNGVNMWIYDDPRNAQNLEGTEVGPDTNDLYVANNVLSSPSSGISVRLSRSNSNQTNTGPNTWFKLLDYDTFIQNGGTLVSWRDSSNAGDYGSLESLQKAHNGEVHGQTLQPTPGTFADPVAGNYKITSRGALSAGTPLPSDVAALLGVPTSAGTVRGAIAWPGSG